MPAIDMEERSAKLRLAVCVFFVAVLPSACGLLYAVTLFGWGRSTELGFSLSSATATRARRTSLRMGDGYFCYGTSSVEAKPFRKTAAPMNFSASPTQIGTVVTANAYLRVDNGSVGQPFLVPMAPVQVLARSLFDTVDQDNIPIGNRWGRLVSVGTHYFYFAGFMPLVLSLPLLIFALTAWPRKRPDETARRGFELVSAVPLPKPEIRNPKLETSPKSEIQIGR
jgi:hypothetical protein